MSDDINYLVLLIAIQWGRVIVENVFWSVVLEIRNHLVIEG